VKPVGVTVELRVLDEGLELLFLYLGERSSDLLEDRQCLALLQLEVLLTLVGPAVDAGTVARRVVIRTLTEVRVVCGGEGRGARQSAQLAE
jgi:hypothetical protein